MTVDAVVGTIAEVDQMIHDGGYTGEEGQKSKNETTTTMRRTPRGSRRSIQAHDFELRDEARRPGHRFRKC